MKVLVLFSGTASIENAIQEIDKKVECRGLDIDKRFNPYYCVDILKWDYKQELTNWIPDYIHASPVCKEFSVIKNSHNRDLALGYSLVDKAIEIIEFVEHLNINLKFTVENPVNKYMRQYMDNLDIPRYTTSYCKYGFPYRKNTDFFSNVELKLRDTCKKDCSKFVKKNRYHYVTIGYKKPIYPLQKQLEYYVRQDLGLPNRFNRYRIVYRIPNDLCKDIYNSIIS
jgi:hypothetical protein